MIRIGSSDEKELLFRAFIEKDEFFEYKKRATKDKPAETIQESIYDRVVRLPLQSHHFLLSEPFRNLSLE